VVIETSDERVIRVIKITSTSDGMRQAAKWLCDNRVGLGLF
jgi:hypothetical protein